MTGTLARRQAVSPRDTERKLPRRVVPVLVSLLKYATNHVVGHLPSHTARRWWYQRVLGIAIGPGSAVDLGCYVWFFGPSQIRRDGVRIGARTKINRDCCIDARGSVTIGDDVSISPSVAVLTTQHSMGDPGFPLQTKGVVIEDHVWIGMRATVLPGASIGRGAVVAAGAVVRGEVPPLAVVAGVPARVVSWRPDTAAGYQFEGLVELFE